MDPVLMPESVKRRVAVDSRTDPRTVAKLLAGKPIRPMTRERIVDAMRDLRLLHLLPRDVAPARRR